MKAYKSIWIIAMANFIIGCSNTSHTFTPTVEQPQQYIQKNLTHHHYKIIDFRTMIERDNKIQPIYIFIENSLKSEASASELPDIKTLTYSLLKDFGNKVQVITSATQINSYLKNPKIANQIYILDGAITTYDKTISSQSSSLNFSLNIGDNKNRNKFKNKKKVSQLIGDFYLRDNKGIISHKSSSSITSCYYSHDC